MFEEPDDKFKAVAEMLGANSPDVVDELRKHKNTGQGMTTTSLRKRYWPAPKTYEIICRGI